MNTLLAALVLLVIAGPAVASDPLTPGADVPRIEPTEWINHPKVAQESLKGRVVAYLFLRIEDEDCLFFLEGWAELRRRFVMRPVTFFAITNEAPNFVKEQLETEDITSPILIDASDQSAKDFGVQLFPTVFLQGANGTIEYYGQPGSTDQIADAIIEALRGAHEFPTLSKRQRAISGHVDKWKLGLAYAAIEKELAKPKIEEADKKLLVDTKTLILWVTDRLRAAAEGAIEEEEWLDAVVALSRLVDEHEGVPGAETAAGKLSELKAREELKDEVAAALEFAKGDRFERDRNWKNAHREYASLAKSHPDTLAGARARDLAILLESRAKR